MNAGQSAPLGASMRRGGVNFSVYSKHATGVELLLFDREDDIRPSRTVTLDPVENRSYHYWHVFVPGVKTGQIYGYRVAGPFDPVKGMRFDPSKVLLDPYGRGVAVPKNNDRAAAGREGDNAATAMKSVVVDPRAYDWEGDVPLKRPSSRTVVYEMHVAGFTRNPNSGVDPEKRGTYAGLIEKVPYLKSTWKERWLKMLEIVCAFPALPYLRLITACASLRRVTRWRSTATCSASASTPTRCVRWTSTWRKGRSR